MQNRTLSLVDLCLGSRLDFLERLETLAVASLVLVLGEVEVLHTLVLVVVVAAPTPQVVVEGRRWGRSRHYLRAAAAATLRASTGTVTIA